MSISSANWMVKIPFRHISSMLFTFELWFSSDFLGLGAENLGQCTCCGEVTLLFLNLVCKAVHLWDGLLLNLIYCLPKGWQPCHIQIVFIPLMSCPMQRWWVLPVSPSHAKAATTGWEYLEPKWSRWLALCKVIAFLHLWVMAYSSLSMLKHLAWVKKLFPACITSKVL